MTSCHRFLLALATLLTVVVVPLGAWVRLSDAGLGCPDWPGCYGHLVGVPDSPAELAAAASAYPQQPVESAKAWKEMIHRYAAGTLGLLILLVAVSAWRSWRRGAIERAPWMETAVIGVVIFQALLGMWTVTELLKPVVVTAHLLGGMTILTLLALLLWGEPTRGLMQQQYRADALTTRLGLLSLVLLVAQIALGGWVSSNYAALACSDFPTCGGSWWPAVEYGPAFHLQRELGETASGELLSQAALQAIHWTHRIGALAVLVSCGAYALRLVGRTPTRAAGLLLTALLLTQAGLGMANVILSLPITIAVAHNLGAALLLATLAVTLRRGCGDHRCI